MVFRWHKRTLRHFLSVHHYPSTQRLPLAAFGLAAVVACLGPSSGRAQTPAAPPNSAERVLVVGATPNNYPYSFLGAGGQVEGFSVDLFDAVAKAAHLRYRREVALGNELSSRFAKGEFDALQLFSETPEREAYAEFSVPYFTLQSSIFVRAGAPLKQLADLAGKRFAMVGYLSMGERLLSDEHVAVQLVHVDSAEQALRAVQDGDCAATFLTQLTALAVIQHSHLHDLVPLGNPYPNYESRQCLAVHRGDAQLLARINEGLAIIHRNGAFDEIYRKWYGRYDAPLFTRRQVIGWAVAFLAVALAVALAAYLRQRRLLHQVERQKAELAGQTALLHALYDHIPTAMAVIAVEPAGPRILSLNREAGRLYGIEPEGALAQPLGRLPIAEGPRLHLEDVLRRRQGEQIIHYEYRWPADRRVLEVTIVPLSHEGEGPPRLCVLAADVTARKQLDSEIAQSRKLRAVGELVGGIAHEFNNLLTPIMLKVGEIQLDWTYDSKLQQEVEVIAKAAQRAAALTQRLLTFGRKTEIQPEAMRIESVVASCIELLRHTVDRRILWEAEVPPGLPPLPFSGSDLNQILINLLLNARDTLLDKLSRPHEPDWQPRIQVKVSLLPPDAAEAGKPGPGGVFRGWQRVTVRDNGLGMAPEVTERVFEPFFTTKEVGKGTGLGLATVWHLVTHGGGRVEIESVPGLGSAFHIFLPVWAVDPAPSPKRRAAAGAAAAGVEVLLVEDEPLVAKTVATVLSRHGHRVHTIADGSEAWHHLSERLGAYTLLVIDVNLPGMNGVDLVGLARAKHFAGRVLIMSGRLALPDLSALAQLHVDRVLTKPFTVEQFDQAVRDCLAGPEALRESAARV
jgi:PAS domain S-box-containing protein